MESSILFLIRFLIILLSEPIISILLYIFKGNKRNIELQKMVTDFSAYSNITYHYTS